ncbi:fructose-6-phosphate aldolase [Candidatus Bandiella euplotis]|uniref:Transaldolase n=1 Tax=Candidatus Bandiella euplotis TaxID=1664265 RepID=A0ABZ0UN90_9RICK|nr:fructose-6-phosphate aldolase [Candidatus Bandiella woodruffii]WPX96558.1 putative transaldolase [Candidatus Bandiella woodruffii]
MKVYLDSCDVAAIKKYKELGVVDGVTTNPSIIAKSKQDFGTVIREICEIIDTSVSVEVIATDYDNMLREAERLSEIAPQITIKLPITQDGLKACKVLAEKSIAVNMTLCFSPTQALLAAKAGATYVSPFIGRLDDMGRDGIALIADICAIYQNYPDISTQILAASIRNPIHIIEVAKLGVDVITLPPSLISAMINNPLTEKGIEIFLNDWSTVKT